MRIRELPDSSLKTRRLGEIRTVVYASPEYFARHGHPRHPDDLAHHRCILRSTSEGESEAWRFRISGRLRSVRVSGCFSTDNTSAAQADPSPLPPVQTVLTGRRADESPLVRAFRESFMPRKS